MKEFTWPEILAAVDHTQLKAAASWEQIRILCEEASEFGTASVCLPPSYVARARAAFPGLKICTVIGFPLGYQTTAVKVFEAERAIEDGADEIDMVINLGDVKNREMERVTEGNPQGKGCLRLSDFEGDRGGLRAGGRRKDSPLSLRCRRRRGLY